MTHRFSPITHKFLSAVRRRIAMIRIAESVAIASAVAAVVGLPLLAMLWWSGRPGLPVAAGLLGLGIVCGLVRGVARYPSRLQAAIEADRQLHLDDLLATVLTLPPAPADAETSQWQATLAALSEVACNNLRPSAIVASRLGLRCWSGVGVLAALLLTLGMLTAQPAPVSAAAPQRGPLASPAASSPLATLSNSPSSPQDRPPGPGGADEESPRNFQQDQPVDSTTSTAQTANADNPSHPGGANSSNAGGGTAVTHPPQNPSTPPILANGTTPPSLSGPAATGNGQSDSRAHIPGSSDSSTTANQSTPGPPPPWASSDWPAAAGAAQQAIDSGQVPDSAADLVRDYFRRDADRSRP